MFKVSAGFIKAVGFFTFLMLFEFVFFFKRIFILLPWRTVEGSCFYDCLAALLVPLHHWVEQRCFITLPLITVLHGPAIK